MTVNKPEGLLGTAIKKVCGSIDEECYECFRNSGCFLNDPVLAHLDSGVPVGGVEEELYHFWPDDAPLHAQGSSVSFSYSPPNTSAMSNSPVKNSVVLRFTAHIEGSLVETACNLLVCERWYQSMRARGYPEGEVETDDLMEYVVEIPCEASTPATHPARLEQIVRDVTEIMKGNLEAEKGLALVWYAASQCFNRPNSSASQQSEPLP